MPQGGAMTKFTGQECPACCEKFAEGDDVVVCPDCGAPHHRLCYAENGECIHAAQHSRIRNLEFFVDALKQTEQRIAEHNAAANAKDFEEYNVFGASKAELSAYMHIEPDSLEYRRRLVHIKVININIFAGVLLAFYQFYIGMRTLGMMLLFLLLLYPVLPLVSLLTLFMLLFNDYFYLRSCALKVRVIRRLYAALPGDLRKDIGYYDFLRIKGKPSIARAVFESVLMFFLFIFISQWLGIEIGSLP
jgi:hypothetical protein